MDIGLGLPSTIAGIPGRRIVEWAAAAERAGFSSLGTIDRVVYGNHETIPTLAAAAAVTTRVRLVTSILIAPFRGNGTLLAKQLASVDSISGGRLTVGIAVGGRQDDYDATASPFQTRGRLFDRQLAEMREVWSGSPRGFAGAVGPAPVQAGGPPLLLGGGAEAALRRMVEYGAGWIFGGGGPDAFRGGAERARQAWRQGGRQREPRLVALAYASLGERGQEHARSYLGDYYSFGGFADAVVAGALTTPDAVRGAVSAFQAAGCDELILFPCSADLQQVDLIAAAVMVSEAEAAPGIEERAGRPAAVVAAAVICLVAAGFCGLGVLAGVVITVLGAEAHGAGTDSGLLISAGLVIVAVFLVVGLLYVLCGRGLLRGRRAWYLAALGLLSLSVVVGVVGFALQRNLWDLLWPVVDVVAIGLLVGTPRSRAFFPAPAAP